MEPKSYEPAGYESDLSDAEWELIKPIIYPVDARRGRGRQRDPDSARACLDTIRYVRKTGCQWSMIPKNLAPRSTAHDALSTWTGARLVAQPQRSPAHQDAFDAKKTPCPAPLSSTAKPSKAGNYRL
ncbi:MAG: transposase [Verrucomicrobiaceae bacterium]|nr:transposase [Verrucomicrobiaceae bacterium]